ncbi:ubiquinol oxidase subunit II [Arhodomonas aquaeolei]|uniref:ubiquinol oxidase subunit II n=1 Tax=Arhodomonas aquaeolei TaxID=2369 RepID=UPI0003A03B26|nr:ubiquinol oxidase subunit II [Arhodomonas aquaeolei]
MLKPLRIPLLALLLVSLGGCQMVVLDPAGQVAMGERNLLIASTVLMLLIIVPVMVLTAVIAYRYRHSNREADYQPDWEHSITLELVIWSAPLLIIIALGALTWIGTHKLDPYRPVEQTAAAGETEPLHVQVVSMDWKWLFFYPDYGIATVNQLAAPVDRPIEFRLTSDTVMNSFYIPALAGQIYTMAGMQTELHAVINEVGDYKGFSANISGEGFTDMRFRFKGMTDKGFRQWIERVRSQGDELDRTGYMALQEPTRDEPVHYYSGYADHLYRDIVHRCVDPDTPCTRATGPDDEPAGAQEAATAVSVEALARADAK